MFAPRQCQCFIGIGERLGKHRIPGAAVVGHDVNEVGCDAAVNVRALWVARDPQAESEGAKIAELQPLIGITAIAVQMFQGPCLHLSFCIISWVFLDSTRNMTKALLRGFEGAPVTIL